MESPAQQIITQIPETQMPDTRPKTKLKRHIVLILLVFSVVAAVSIFYVFYNNTTFFNGTIIKPSIFTESGLPNGYSWSVTYSNITSKTHSNYILFTPGNGKYHYKIPTLQNSSNNCTTTYTPELKNGTVFSGTTIKVNFYHSTLCKTVISVTGIPTGYTINSRMNNSVIKISADSDKVVFTPPGIIHILSNVSGLNCNASGTFLAGTSYKIANWICNTTVYEKGIPNNIVWRVEFLPNSGGHIIKAANSGSPISFIGPISNGSYLTNFFNYNNKGCQGTFTPSSTFNTFIPGSTDTINFSGQITCTTSFVESGLPYSSYTTINASGVPSSTTYDLNVKWSVTFDGQTQNSSYSPAIFSTPMGNYTFSISPVYVSSNGCTTTYIPSISGGTLQAGSQENITFSESVSCAPAATYDEQIGMTFTEDFTSLAYYVIAVPQNDSYGYGPAYLLNGLTNEGYWYQVGLSYDWPFVGQNGYNPGFNVNYEVFNSSGRSIDPANGGGGLLHFSGTVNPGDHVLLSLYFNNGMVYMDAEDVNTSAYADASFSAYGADEFIGDTSGAGNSNGFFTGLMTEWYHVNEYYNGESLVKYIPNGFPNSSAWLWADEKTGNNVIFSGSTSNPVSTSPYYSFTYDNASCTYYSNGEFTTGS